MYTCVKSILDVELNSSLLLVRFRMLKIIEKFSESILNLYHTCICLLHMVLFVFIKFEFRYHKQMLIHKCTSYMYTYIYTYKHLLVFSVY